MPGKPVRPCNYPGCGVLNDDKRSRCPAHQEVWVKRPDAKDIDRIRGPKLQKLRRRLFAEQPLCVLCLAKVPSVVTLARHRDHIIPLEEGGSEDVANTQPLCVACHEEKSKAERERARHGR